MQNAFTRLPQAPELHIAPVDPPAILPPFAVGLPEVVEQAVLDSPGLPTPALADPPLPMLPDQSVRLNPEAPIIQPYTETVDNSVVSGHTPRHSPEAPGSHGAALEHPLASSSATRFDDVCLQGDLPAMLLSRLLEWPGPLSMTATEGVYDPRTASNPANGQTGNDSNRLGVQRGEQHTDARSHGVDRDVLFWCFAFLREDGAIFKQEAATTAYAHPPTARCPGGLGECLVRVRVFHFTTLPGSGDTSPAGGTWIWNFYSEGEIAFSERPSTVGDPASTASRCPKCGTRILLSCILPPPAYFPLFAGGRHRQS